MKTLLALAGLALIVSVTGCNTTSYESVKDGTRISVKNSRVFWSSESYSVQFSTNSASLTANKSTGDAASIEAVAAGVVKGMKAAP